MILIREMSVKDLDEVSRMEAENFTVPWSYNGFANALKNKNTIYLAAEFNGKLAGYLGMRQILDEGEITNVCVDKTLRGLGIGYKLLEYLFQTAAVKGVASLFLEVRKSNEPAIQLYQKSGFIECGIRKAFYQKPVEDAVLMQKAIGLSNGS